MGEMHMPFPLKDGLDLEGFAIGDAITLTFEVRYDPDTDVPIMIQASNLEALSDDVALVIDPAESTDDAATQK